MARYVEAWLKPFLVNDVLGNLLVWPNRIVIPIMPESVTGPLDDLRLSTRGILRVTAVEARRGTLALRGAFPCRSAPDCFGVSAGG